IPPEYKTNLLTIMHTLRDMEGQECRWVTDTRQIGILLADSAMYQRAYPEGVPYRLEASTVRWNPFYGLSLPLFKSGACVRPVQLDNVRRYAGYLGDYRVLVLSYEYMKPDGPDLHNAIAGWVREGGVLMVVGDGSDAFHGVREWWNQSGADYRDPAQHLFEALGLGRDPAEAVYAVGKGQVGVCRLHPMNIAESGELCDAYMTQMHALLRVAGLDFEPSSHLLMRRGPYTVSAVINESVDTSPMVVEGLHMNLLDDDLAIVRDPVQMPDDVGLWMTVDPQASEADILAASGRVENIVREDGLLCFKLTGPSEMKACVRVQTPREPKSILLACGDEVPAHEAVYDEESRTTLITFASSTEGVEVKVGF
ncbi:MAG: hypothetical protein IKT43_04870, partial [Clostridia bacterium]|nr:hypothetical protein [Clostridia bacterium]